MSELTTDHYAEVYGYVDQTNGHIQASRIEVTIDKPSTYKLSGAIDQIDLSSQRAILGQTSIKWDEASVLPTDVANTAYVRATLQTTPSGLVYRATRIQVLTSALSKVPEDKIYQAEIKGSITAFSSNAQFTVKGIPVDASNAKVSGNLRLGAQVEIKGTVKSGKLFAQAVAVESAQEVESKDYEFIGFISNITDQTFIVKEITFDYDNNTENKNLLKKPSIKDKKIKVKAKRTNGRWLAVQIETDDCNGIQAHVERQKNRLHFKNSLALCKE